MWEFLKGKKTYIVAVGAIVYAVFQYELGQIDWSATVQSVQIALMGATIRHGIGEM